MRSSDAAAPEPRIWAVGGGKGGIGKTVVASSLAVAFAHRGRRCVLVDADLGGANVHTVLGVPRPPRTLAHFLRREVDELHEVACPTPIANLRFVSGAHAVFDAANPHYSHKLKLLRHLARLDADDVFIDLSAGSSFNVLDFFLAAQHGILLVTPEPTAIENAQQFLKAAWFRSLRAVATIPNVREVLRSVLTRRPERPDTPLALIVEVALIDGEAGRALMRCAREFEVKLLVNQATRAHRHLGAKIAEECRASLGVTVDVLGSLAHDERVRSAVAEGRSVIDLFPGCDFVDDLESVVDGLMPARPEVSICDELPTNLSRPGSVLRRRREQLGLDLSLLIRRTRIQSLRWLEDECFDDLPPEPYVRGHVLQYARELGIRDPDALASIYLARYRRARGAGPPALTRVIHDPS
jgi:flagellar biosynthesis protein FlhG